MKGYRTIVGTGLLVVFALATVFFVYAPRIAADRFNPVLSRGPYAVPDSVRQFHESLLIVDLHADQTLWDRDVTKRSDVGHVDLPRLREGNVAIQVFSAVTKSPVGQNHERNEGDTDRITRLVVGQLWPVRTWNSLLERALYQAKKLQIAETKDALFRILRSKHDLDTFLRDRKQNRKLTAGILAIEGMHTLEAEISNFARLADAGFRMMAATHFFDNEVSGSAHGLSGEGLSPLGRQMIKRQIAQGIMIDVAHISPAAIDDILEMSDEPLVFSHGGVQATCPTPRNLSDRHIKAIAESGGVIGVGYWDTALCGEGVDAIIRAMSHIRELTGSTENIALGSDFDGTVTTPFDTAGIIMLTEGLLSAGYTETEIRQIMGENALRVFLQVLPLSD